MLKKSFILSGLLIVTTSSIQAKNIDDVVTETLNQNYSIKALESSIDITKEQIELSTKWKNPTLSIGATDIQLNDITTRDKEPMQAHFIGFSQTIPVGEKLEIQKSIAQDEYQISKYEVLDKKLQLKSKIYQYIYNIKLLEERLSLFEKYKVNTLNLEKLLKELYKYNRANQAQILKTQIMTQELNLKSQNLKAMINTLNLKLEQITYTKQENIDFDNRLKNITLYNNVEKHPKLLSIKQSSKKFENLSKLEIEKKYSDVNMNLTYFQRDSKYEDYVNISFAIPLSIRGSEDIKSRKAKFKAVEINHKYNDMKLTFENKLKTFQQNINDAHISYNIIKKNILPKFNQLEKTIETYNSFSSYKNMDSKALINNLNEIIKYELKAIDEKQKYFTALASSLYFNEEIE